MSDLSPNIVSDVVAACQAGTGEAAAALGRCFDGEFELSVGETGAFADETTGIERQGLDGPGLMILLTFGSVGMVGLLPESTGLLPDWYATADAEGESKLSTLADELSKVLAPESLKADRFVARRVDMLREAVRRGQVADDACLVSLNLQSGDTSGQLSLVWPLAKPAAVLPGQDAASVGDEGQRQPASAAPAAEAASPQGVHQAKVSDYPQLPSYTRSLLRIQIPVSVKLASKKVTVQEIVELVPGAILKFDKACDQQLHLVVGDREVAEGEAVKVGDKFGFRVGAMLMPEEHFLKVQSGRG